MAPKSEDTRPQPLSQEEFTQILTIEVREAVRFALAAVLEEEVTALVGALPFERSPLRNDQRNGHYRRDLGTSVGLIEQLPVPRTRRGYKTQLFERYARRTQEVDTAISEMFVKGVSRGYQGGKHTSGGRGVGSPDRRLSFSFYSVEGIPYPRGRIPGLEEPPSL